MAHKAAISALREYTNITTRNVSTTEMIQSLSEESDRGLAILAVTAIDDALLGALEAKTTHLSSPERKALFDFENGVFSSFSKRLRLSYAFGYLDKRTYESVDLLRHLRNCAAHARGPVSFDTPVIRHAISALGFTSPDRADLRRYFILLCGMLVDKIEGRVEVVDGETILELDMENTSIMTVAMLQVAMADMDANEQSLNDETEDATHS